MESTGMIRHIDDIGSIVIPKEIRHFMKIKDGAPFEIFIGEDGSIILKPYEEAHTLEIEYTTLHKVNMQVNPKDVNINDKKELLSFVEDKLPFEVPAQHACASLNVINIWDDTDKILRSRR